MSDFIRAVTEWQKKKETFVNNNTSKGRVAPRKNIFITIPVSYEEDIRGYIAAKRKEADAIFDSEREAEKTALALQFEKSNPPPRRVDFTT